MKWFIYIVSLLTVLFSQCTTYHIAKPIFPVTSNPGREPELVPSLQPLLSWEPSEKIAVSYDIVIYEVIVDSSIKKDIRRTLGGKIYYRENLFGNSHLVQAVLKPDTEYCWSLRVRNGEEISEWACYDYRSLLIFDPKKKDSYYGFKTPYMRPLVFRAFNPVDHW